MASDTTTLQVVYGDITNLTISQDSTAVTVSNTNLDTTILLAAPATISVPSISFSTANPSDVTVFSSPGVSNSAARADHIHSAASLLLDGGNY
jgi:hypothetical protein